MHTRIIFIFTLLLFTKITLDAQVLTPEYLWKLGRVNLEDASSDGKYAAYTVAYYDLNENKGKTNLYTVDLMTNQVKILTDVKGNVSNAQYNKDNRIIYFLLDGILNSINTDGSNLQKISDEEMNGFSLSPDNSKILYCKDVKYDNVLGSELYSDLPKSTVRVADGLMYRHWKSWEDGAYSNIFVADIKDNKISVATNIMKNEPYNSPLAPMGGMEQIAWSVDGKKIAYTCKKMRGTASAISTNSDIYIYDLASAATTNLTKGMMGYDTNPTFSPDGKYIAWNSMERPMFEADRNRIFIADLSTNVKEEVTVGVDREANNVIWANDSKTLYYIGGDKATFQIFAIDINQKQERELTQGDHDYHSIVLAGDQILASRMDMANPIELFHINTRNGQQKQVTFTNKAVWENIKKAKVEKRFIKTTDGKDMLVWVIFPPNFDPNKKYPTLLYCQGGPQSAVSQFFSYRWNFQLMASNDYIIVAPNRRGLPSFGQAWNDEISGDWGGQCMQDYLSAIDAVKKEPYVNADKLGAIGASFGGYSVFWLAGNHNKRFKTFIAHAGVFNLESAYGTTEEVFFNDYEMQGPYWDAKAKEEYQKFSPHNYVKNWDTPILITHGELDFRVPFSEGIQAFQAAQLRNIPSKFVMFPDEGHWITKPQNSLLWQREFYSWLDKWLK